MIGILRRHPLPISATLHRTVVLTYAFPEDLLTPLLPPGLELDRFRGLGFVAVATVQARELRPTGLPPWLGSNLFLAGYRIFSRCRIADGRRLRGLKILRSDTDNRLIATTGNLLTRYGYHLVSGGMTERNGTIRIDVRSRDGNSDLVLTADLASRPASPPEGSLFASLHEARRYAGPLPFTFEYEAATKTIIRVEGVRTGWAPEPVTVRMERISFFDHGPFAGHAPIFCGAFTLGTVPYHWRRGVREPAFANTSQAVKIQEEG